MVSNVRASQVVDEALGVGTPSLRSSQVVGEVLDVGTPNLRASQVAGEALYVGTPDARCSQVFLEVLCLTLERAVLPIYPTLIGLGFNVKWAPVFFNAPTQTTSTGADIDLALADSPLHDFELTYEFLRDSPFAPGSVEFRTMMGFFLRIGGTNGRFLFNNPDDNYVSAEPVGTTDGATSVFGPLTRTYGVGDNVGVEPVGVLDLTRPYNVYLDGVHQDPSTYEWLTDDPANQQLKFGSTPAAGKAVTADYGFFYYCKFPDNTYTFEKFLHGVWLLSKINLHTCRPGA